jgi:hypothetical protein
MMKKSQIFIFDVIVAFVMIAIVISIILFYFIDFNRNDDIFVFGQEIMKSFTGTLLMDLNDEEIRLMFVRGDIKNFDLSVAQQIAEYYHLGRRDLAVNLSSIFLSSFDFSGSYFSLAIINSTMSDSDYLYMSNDSRGVSFSDAEVASKLYRNVLVFDRNDIGIDAEKYRFELEIWS